MKTRALSTISMTLALGVAGAMAGATGQSPSAKKPAMHDKMDMAHGPMMMAIEPHHVLAMAYHQNLAAFAKALHDQTAPAGPLNVDFARAAVSEMRRSFVQMKQHHQEHMQGMSADMRAKMDPRMSGMMDKMKTHETEINGQLTALEQEIALKAPDPKMVSTLAGRVHAHLTEMAKMHEGC